MKNQQIFNDIGKDDLSRNVAYCWWRSSNKYDECAIFNQNESRNLSKITPRVKIMREMERLALLASEGLDELRHKLLTYRAGDFWVPIGGIKKEDLEIPPVNTILLVGFHNAGKSSLVNLMYSLLGHSGLVPFAQTSSGSASSCTTLFMEEHNVLRSMRNGFCVYDTRGFDYDRLDQSLEELMEWMTNGVHHQELCLREGDDDVQDNYGLSAVSSSSSAFITRKVNCVMVVANVAEIYKGLKLGDKTSLEALKQLYSFPALSKSNDHPILILTHGDMLSADDRLDARVKISEYLGISQTSGIYEIVCVTEYGLLADEFDPVSAYAVTEAVYRALIISDGGHLPKRKLQYRMLDVFCWILRSIGALFAFLAVIFSKLGQKN